MALLKAVLKFVKHTNRVGIYQEMAKVFAENAAKVFAENAAKVFADFLSQ